MRHKAVSLCYSIIQPSREFIGVEREQVELTFHSLLELAKLLVSGKIIDLEARTFAFLSSIQHRNG